MTQATLNNNTLQHRYELVKQEQVVAFTNYAQADNVTTFLHTEVCAGHEGKGYGSALAKLALDEVHAQGRQVIPVCEFIAGYIQKHPEYQMLVSREH